MTAWNFMNTLPSHSTMMSSWVTVCQRQMVLCEINEILLDSTEQLHVSIVIAHTTENALQAFTCVRSREQSGLGPPELYIVSSKP